MLTVENGAMAGAVAGTHTRKEDVMGYLVLQGGSEFSGAIAASDSRALELAGGRHSRICIVPAAAAPDNNHQRAGTHGKQWFASLGASHVELAAIIDRASADDFDQTAALYRSRLVYLLGGFPSHLAQTLRESESWRAIRHVFDQGGVVAGSSAGAMVLCDYYYDPGKAHVESGLGLVADACLLPHHDTYGFKWVCALRHLLPQTTLIGLDEKTAIINDAQDGKWTVYGPGAATLYKNGCREIYSDRQTLGI